MAKALASVDRHFLKDLKVDALDLLTKSLQEARKGGAASGEPAPPFFRNGIELIRVKFEVSAGEVAKLAFELEVGGPEARALTLIRSPSRSSTCRLTSA